MTVSERHADHAGQVAEALIRAGIRVTCETSSDKLGAKIRQAQLEKIPLMLVVGDKEVEAGAARVRLRDGSDRGAMPLPELLAFVQEACQVPVVS